MEQPNERRGHENADGGVGLLTAGLSFDMAAACEGSLNLHPNEIAMTFSTLELSLQVCFRRRHSENPPQAIPARAMA